MKSGVIKVITSNKGGKTDKNIQKKPQNISIRSPCVDRYLFYREHIKSKLSK